MATREQTRAGTGEAPAHAGASEGDLGQGTAQAVRGLRTKSQSPKADTGGSKDMYPLLPEEVRTVMHPSGLTMFAWNWPFKSEKERAMVIAWNRKQARRTKQDNLNDLGEALW